MRIRMDTSIAARTVAPRHFFALQKKASGKAPRKSVRRISFDRNSVRDFVETLPCHRAHISSQSTPDSRKSDHCDGCMGGGHSSSTEKGNCSSWNLIKKRCIGYWTTLNLLGKDSILLANVLLATDVPGLSGPWKEKAIIQLETCCNVQILQVVKGFALYQIIHRFRRLQQYFATWPLL